MQQPDYPSSPSAGAPPNVEHPHAVAARTHDVEPGPVLRFAQELGRLLGAHLARAGFRPDGPANPQAVPPRHGAVPMPEGAGAPFLRDDGPRKGARHPAISSPRTDHSRHSHPISEFRP